MLIILPGKIQNGEGFSALATAFYDQGFMIRGVFPLGKTPFNFSALTFRQASLLVYRRIIHQVCNFSNGVFKKIRNFFKRLFAGRANFFCPFAPAFIIATGNSYLTTAERREVTAVFPAAERPERPKITIKNASGC